MAGLTPKGAATKARIVESAADLVLARGMAGTSLDDICAGTATSKSQLFHYFHGGKAELVGSIAELQFGRVLDAQRPHIDELDRWESWQAWRDAVVAHYGSQEHWGCPIGALASEVAGREPVLQAQLTASMDLWRDLLADGVDRMRTAGLVRSDTDPSEMALGMFAALQGGLLLMQTMELIHPLEVALDSALITLRSAAA
jgi:AcrR family transcriptional regulator